MSDDYHHNDPPDDDLPRFVGDNDDDTPPRAIPSDDLAGFIATLRGARAARPPEPEPQFSQDDKDALESDIQDFLRTVSGSSRPDPDFAPGTFDPPQFEDDVGDDIPDDDSNEDDEAYQEPDAVASAYADDLDADDAPNNAPNAYDEPPRRLPPEKPDPATQSSFVNPALARIVAARPAREAREPGELWLGLRTIVIILSAAVIVSFIFNYWTPDSFLSDAFVANLQIVSSTQGPPTPMLEPLPTYAPPQRIGIVTGHSGPPLDPTFQVDPGAVCDDNGDGIAELTELEVNTSVSLRLASLLVEAGYEVEMLNEWDDRLNNYRASILISIHANTCENLGFGATGFNINTGELRRASVQGRDSRLADCLAAEYANATGLPRHFGTSPDLVDYHAFRKVSLDTPMAIVELGFMAADRQILTTQQDNMARGVFEGLLCFLDWQNPS